MTIVLLHGATSSRRAWDEVIPAIKSDCRILAPTLSGHFGGQALQAEPVHVVDGIVDGMCAYLDGLGIGQAHLVGNSLGGWVALELARRGRAKSVLALSPAGAWRTPRDLRRLLTIFQLGAVGARHVDFIGGLIRHPRMRRAFMRPVAEHGDRMSTSQVEAVLEDMAGCSVLTNLLAGARQRGPIAPFERLDCPVRIAWGVEDKTLPFMRYGVPMAAALPGAELRMVPGVGHVPMIDDPVLVAHMISEYVVKFEKQ
ncbi:alpha/beta fold hydrolase [Mycolicibacterium sp. P9-22]|uniref:alpha/beta fold hydrolase n=1 Tax=Mycolicibacterium sp. P9-22 TaxID=2024613 RepID=UPI0011EED164|nr:alpha/beta fold hydrolase [Mycolicibacterium sp. P9-22]KAA0120564.1 alpha/beta fold hydrolase [Mycolicibacterium sp. P9-22]